MQFKVSYPRVVIPLVPPVVFGVCFVFMVLLLIFRTVNPTLWDHRFQSGGQLKSLPIASNSLVHLSTQQITAQFSGVLI